MEDTKNHRNKKNSMHKHWSSEHFPSFLNSSDPAHNLLNGFFCIKLKPFAHQRTPASLPLETELPIKSGFLEPSQLSCTNIFFLKWNVGLQATELALAYLKTPGREGELACMYIIDF